MEDYFSLSHLLKTLLSLLAVLALASISLQRFAPYLKSRENNKRKRGSGETQSEVPQAFVPSKDASSQSSPLRLLQTLRLSEDAAVFLIEDEFGERSLFSLDLNGLRVVKNCSLGSKVKEDSRTSNERPHEKPSKTSSDTSSLHLVGEETKA